jgi:hypothetical protein
VSKILKGVAIAAVAVFAPYALAFIAPGVMLGATALTVLNAFAVSSILSGVAAQLAKRPPRPSQTVEYNGTVEPRRLIYGLQLVGGMNVIPAVTTGTNNKYLHKVLALAGHEVNAMNSVYFNQDLVGTIGSITGTTSDGLVSTGTYANKAWVRRYMGTATQTVDFILDTALSIWTSNHRGRGVAYVAVQFESDEKTYKTGAPEVTVLVQGMKVYDPRLDSTNGGAGAQRYATPSTWTYSNNPALCLANYLIDSTLGMGEDAATRIDWAMVATAADECDENVTCPNGSGGSTTQKRYTCNAVFYATEGYQQIISAIAGCMLGTCLYSGGKWRIMAGAWYSSAFTLGDANIISGGISVVTAYDYQERYNGIRGTFLDTANNYQPNEFPAISSATYVSADGESVFKDVQFDCCTDVYEAQRAAILLVRKSRNRQSATLTCDMSAYKIRPGETGIVTCSELGWSSKTVRCEGWKFNPLGYVDLSVREELSSDWNDPILGDYTEPLAISNVTPVYFTPDAPSALTATGSKNGITFNWTAPGIMPSGALYELYEYTANTPFSSASVVWTGIATSTFLPKSDLTTRYYWVAIRMPWETGAVAGGHEPSGNGLAGAATPVANMGLIARGNCVVDGSSASKVGGSSAWDSDVYSINGYTAAHVRFKANTAVVEVMVGLNTYPLYDQSYGSLDYAWNLASDSVPRIYESGTNIGTYGSYAASSHFAVTYDGSNIRYYKDGVVVRTVAIGGLTVYMDSTFYDPGSAINSLYFGPGTSIEPVDTGGLGDNAATVTHLSTANATSITTASGVPIHSHTQSVVSVTMTPLVTGVLRCIYTGTCTFTNSTGAAAAPQITCHGGSAGTTRTYYPGKVGAGATGYVTFSITHEISCTAGTSITVTGGAARFVPGDTLTIDYCDLSVEEIRR